MAKSSKNLYSKDVARLRCEVKHMERCCDRFLAVIFILFPFYAYGLMVFVWHGLPKAIVTVAKPWSMAVTVDRLEDRSDFHGRRMMDLEEWMRAHAQADHTPWRREPR